MPARTCRSAQARLVLETLEQLDLQDVTLIGNDTGGALVQLIAPGDAPRVGRIVLVSCEAFYNFPPPTVKPLLLAGRLPAPLFGLFMQQMQIKRCDGCRSPSAGSPSAATPRRRGG